MKKSIALILCALIFTGCAKKTKEALISGEDSRATDTTAKPAVSDTISSIDPLISGLPKETLAAETTVFEETTDTADYIVEPLSETMYSVDTLNVREKPSTDSKIVGQLNPGDEVKIVGKLLGEQSGWYAADYNGSRAYVFGEYLSQKKPEIEKEEVVLPENYYFASDDDYLFVVNKDVFLPEDYQIETSFVQGSYELEAVAALHCREMIEAAKEDGIDLKVLSAYRTVEYQKNLFDRNVKSRMEDDGMSYEEAYADVSINIAPPGGSEHNAGLAVDIIDEDHWDTYEGFEDTKEFGWLIKHCTEYGFILRYPKGKEDITGYIYEPWHYRYVGLSNADDVMKSGLCLEEYLG